MLANGLQEKHARIDLQPNSDKDGEGRNKLGVVEGAKWCEPPKTLLEQEGRNHGGREVIESQEKQTRRNGALESLGGAPL